MAHSLPAILPSARAHHRVTTPVLTHRNNDPTTAAPTSMSLTVASAAAMHSMPVGPTPRTLAGGLLTKRGAAAAGLTINTGASPRTATIAQAPTAGTVEVDAQGHILKDMTKPSRMVAGVPEAFRKQFEGRPWSAIQRALNALNVSESSITKGGAMQLLRDFSLVEPTPEKLEEALKEIGYKEGTALSLNDLMNLVIWFIYQSMATAPSKSEAAFEALTISENADLLDGTGDLLPMSPSSPSRSAFLLLSSSPTKKSQAQQQQQHNVAVRKLRGFIEQFGLDVSAHVPHDSNFERRFTSRFPLLVTTPDETSATVPTLGGEVGSGGDNGAGGGGPNTLLNSPDSPDTDVDKQRRRDGSGGKRGPILPYQQEPVIGFNEFTKLFELSPQDPSEFHSKKVKTQYVPPCHDQTILFPPPEALPPKTKQLRGAPGTGGAGATIGTAAMNKHASLQSLKGAAKQQQSSHSSANLKKTLLAMLRARRAEQTAAAAAAGGPGRSTTRMTNDEHNENDHPNSSSPRNRGYGSGYDDEDDEFGEFGEGGGRAGHRGRRRRRTCGATKPDGSSRFPYLKPKQMRMGVSRNGFIKETAIMPPTTGPLSETTKGSSGGPAGSQQERSPSLSSPERWIGSPIQCILARVALFKDADDKFQLMLSQQRSKLGPRPPSALLGVLNPDLPGNFVIRAVQSFKPPKKGSKGGIDDTESEEVFVNTKENSGHGKKQSRDKKSTHQPKPTNKPHQPSRPSKPMTPPSALPAANFTQCDVSSVSNLSGFNHSTATATTTTTSSNIYSAPMASRPLLDMTNDSLRPEEMRLLDPQHTHPAYYDHLADVEDQDPNDVLDSILRANKKLRKRMKKQKKQKVKA